MVKELWRQMLAWFSLLLSNVYIFLMKPECPQILMSWGITFPFLMSALFSLCLTLCNVMTCGQPGSSVHGNFPGKNTLVGCHFIFQGSFLTQGLNLHLLCLLHWQVILYCLSHQGSSQHITEPRWHCWQWFRSVQSLSHVLLFATPWTAARQASLSITNSRSLLKLMSIEPVMPSNRLILCHSFSSRLQSFPASGCFPMSQFLASGGQSIGVSTSASVFPMSIQDWFSLGRTG